VDLEARKAAQPVVDVALVALVPVAWLACLALA